VVERAARGVGRQERLYRGSQLGVAGTNAIEVSGPRGNIGESHSFSKDGFFGHGFTFSWNKSECSY
jgi:hypothetical protein